MQIKPDLEALKQALADAKAVHREAVKAIVDAKRVADAARWRVNEAARAYHAARPPSKRPRRARSVDPTDDLPFPEGTVEEAP